MWRILNTFVHTIIVNHTHVSKRLAHSSGLMELRVNPGVGSDEPVGRIIGAAIGARASSRHIVLPAVLLAVGLALRARQYATDRSFYSDEAYIALNLGTRSVRRLLQPLSWDQNGPLLFLWIERALAVLFGVRELVLRFYPLLGGVLLIAVFWFVAARLLPTRTALLATLSLALSPLLIRYSNEVKPYSTDAFATAVVLLFTLRALEDPFAQSRWLALTLAGVGAITASNPAIFVVAASGAALLAARRVRCDPRLRARVFAFGAACGVTFTALYAVVLRTAAASPYLQRYFRDRLLRPAASDFLDRARVALATTITTAWEGDSSSVMPHFVPMLLSLSVCGVVFLFRDRRLQAPILIVGPLVLALCASAAGQYPVVARTMVFAIPLLILLVSAGVEALLRWIVPSRAQLACAAAAAIGLLVTPVSGDYRDFTHPRVIQHSRPLVATFNRLAGPADPVYISHWGRAAWVFYTTNWLHPDTARANWFNHAMEPRVPHDRVAPVWPASLLRMNGKREELVQALPVGVSMTEDIDPEAGLAAPPVGWADDEARRVRAAAHPVVWLFMVYGLGPYGTSLLGAIANQGGEIVRADGSVDAHLYEVRFR